MQCTLIQAIFVKQQTPWKDTFMSKTSSIVDTATLIRPTYYYAKIIKMQSLSYCTSQGKSLLMECTCTKFPKQVHSLSTNQESSCTLVQLATIWE